DRRGSAGRSAPREAARSPEPSGEPAGKRKAAPAKQADAPPPKTKPVRDASLRSAEPPARLISGAQSTGPTSTGFRSP
ncbi:hypothetical protein, partial [Enterovirga sp.]|uniref:hypothetical protein n=1 Tax=Enterovirga sp. TaxID=2026350 RepID=UPI00260B08D4